MVRNIFWIFLLLPLFSFSQIQDNFTDGDFTANPVWSGDDSLFQCNQVIGNYKLQSWGTIASTASLSTSAVFSGDIEWRFYVRLNLAPSSSNLARVYLMSDIADVQSPLNGYYLQFGEAGTTDVIRLYKQVSSASTLICSGTTNISAAFALDIKVTKSNTGAWNIYSAVPESGNYNPEAAGTDNSITVSTFFGLYYKYTASNIQNFYFDDFYMGIPITDVTPPSLTSVTVLTQNTIDVLFSENVEQVTSESVSNYFVNNSIGIPVTATRDGVNNALIHLAFSGNFTDGITDSLYIYNVQDTNGNAISTVTSTFTYFSPVNIFSDNFSDGNFTQNPVWMGDDSLFVCVQSNSNYQLRLNATNPKTAVLYSDYSMIDSVEWRFFIHLNFSPSSASYARVFLTSDNTDLSGSLNGYFLQFGEANSTDIIRLYKKIGTSETQICAGTASISVPFALKIRVIKSASGVWKLYTAPENSNVYLLEASGSDNTVTSGSYIGLLAKFSSTTYNDDFYFDDFYAGTIIPDTESPAIVSATAVSQDSLDVLFSENLSQVTAETIINYFANNSLGVPVSAQQDAVNKSLVHLVFSTPFPDGIWDTLWVNNVADNYGNAIDTAIVTFRYFIVPDSFSDNFQDADFTQTPVWVGDDSLYICVLSGTNFILRTNGTIPKTAILYTHVAMQDSMEWRFNINLNFSPSSTSNARVYLAADSPDFDNCNGYFLQFGETGDTDKVSLFRQDLGATVELCRGITIIANAFNLNVRITKEADGTWKLYIAQGGSSFYILEAVGFDNTITATSYFGVYSQYSSVSYKDKFFYDNFYAGPIIPDSESPFVMSVTPVNTNTLDVLFSEDVRLAECTNVLNYFVTGNIDNPLTAEQDVVNHALVHLNFSQSFTDGKIDTLSIYNMADNAGNIAATLNSTFQYFAVPNSFSDDFTDGNFTINPIWLGDDSLFICDPSGGNTELRLNGTIPKTTVLYTHFNGVADSVEWHFDVNVLISLSSTSFIKVYLAADKADLKSDLVGYYLQLGESNATDVIRLFRQNGADITEICFGITSISDLFNLRIKVLKVGNSWTIYSAPVASSSYIIEGTGTDSYIMNTSYFGLLCKFSSASYNNAYSFDNFYAGPIIPDTVKPEILSVNIISFNAIDVTFTEPVQILSAQDTINYLLDGSMGFAQNAVRDAVNLQTVHLTFSSNLIGGTNYQITVFNVNDFEGNSTDTATFNFSYEQSPAVINEHFDDGDFYDNPTWNGKITDFIVNPELQLELFTATEDYDTSYLAASVNITTDSCEWQFYTKMNISPSASNFERFYLVSDNSDLTGSLHGYYIQIGENGSNDALVLTRQNGTISTSLFRGTNGIVAVNPVVRVKVTRNFNTGEWKLYADPTGNTNFQLQGSGIDSTFNNSLFYIGPYMRYSSSNATEKFFFDDIYAGKVIDDTIAPSLVNVVLTDSLHLDLQFSENLDLVSGANVLNYFVNKNIGNPVTATLQVSDYSLVSITFNSPVLLDTIYTVTISNIKDIKGNQITSPVSHQFSYHQIRAFDVVINEIMADPSPVVLLPENEYLELYNRTHVDIDLTGWKLTVGSSDKTFPQCKIAADSFLIVVPVGKEYLFQSYGRTVGILSSDGLSNAGTSLVLFNDEGMSISSVTYSDSWYHDNLKKDGGWSVEQIDPLNPCNGANNWKASADTKGGTPGKKNSVYASNPDLTAPILLHAVILSTNDSLRIFFNEPLSVENLTLTMFTVDNNIGQPIGMSVVAPENTSIKLKFSQSFQDEIIYTITVTDLISDCAGNTVADDNSARFGISQFPAANDIVINEVLFNPLADGVDYVEVYNRSSKIIDFVNLRIATRNSTSYQIENAEDIAVEGHLALPASYYVLTINPDIIKQQYAAENPKNFITMNSMPSLNTTSGEIVLADKSLVVIDDFAYNEKMQFALLTSFKGVALERINYDRPASENNNWHSAAQTVGYGTPTYKNSQYLDILNVTDEILISPEIFSPDEDGYNDVLSIGYKFNEPGFNATITIYDARGRLTKKLVKNDLLATSGLFTWTGLDENNNKAEIGIYLLFIEVFDLQGNIKKFKKTCVLAGKL